MSSPSPTPGPSQTTPEPTIAYSNIGQGKHSCLDNNADDDYATAQNSGKQNHKVSPQDNCRNFNTVYDTNIHSEQLVGDANGIAPSSPNETEIALQQPIFTPSTINQNLSVFDGPNSTTTNATRIQARDDMTCELVSSRTEQNIREQLGEGAMSRSAENLHASLQPDFLDGEDPEVFLNDSASDSSDQAETYGDDHGHDSDYKDLDDKIGGEEDDEELPSVDRFLGISNSSAVAEKLQKPQRTRRKPAKNAREFVARLYALAEEKDTKGTNKRKQPQAQGHAAKKHRAMGRNMMSSCLDATAGFVNEDTPDPASVKASTHAEQFKKLVQRIPKNCDTRRASTQAADLREAVRIFGNKKIKAVDGTWKHVDMKSGLRSHQINAASWMIKRELDKVPPHGGLLADTMGLGKTITSLACIIGNPPDDQDVRDWCSATLVIVPNRMIGRQWSEEIEKHCSNDHSTKTRLFNPSENKSGDYYARYWVVIATYYDLRRSYPEKSTVDELRAEHLEDEESYRKALHPYLRDLFLVNWYRVILDESHAIKNHQSRGKNWIQSLYDDLTKESKKAAVVCCDLSSKYRWALSGTPLSNSSMELYPYLRFIGCNFTRNLRDFSKTYGKSITVTANSKDNGKENFEALVSLVMYRRTMQDTFLGEKITPLPPSETKDIWVPLLPGEIKIVKLIEDFYGRKINSIRSRRQKAERVNKPAKGLGNRETELQYAKVIRLRQCVSHVLNLEKLLRCDFSVDDIKQLRGQLSALIKAELKKSNSNPIMKSARPVPGFLSDFSGFNQPQLEVPEGCMDLDGMLQLIQDEANVRDIKCPQCGRSPPVSPTTATCAHVYCLRCLMSLMRSPAITTANPSMAFCRVAACREELKVGKQIWTLSDITEDASDDENVNDVGRDSNGNQLLPQGDFKMMFLASAALGRFPMPLSAKVKATMKAVSKWRREHPDDKMIVFVQFIMTGKVLGYELQKAGIEFIYYFGGQSIGQSSKALEEFRNNPVKNVLVASLHSGGQSLNLTCANRVIIVDPWWNNTLENQAYGRVRRMMQTKKTHLVRILSESGIDTRIDEIQTRKSVEIDYALQDDGHVPQRLDDESLEKLFTSKNDNAPRRVLEE